MDKVWKIMQDADVINIWRDESTGKEISIHPNWYADNGTPLGDDGEDCVYVRTEVRV